MEMTYEAEVGRLLCKYYGVQKEPQNSWVQISFGLVTYIQCTHTNIQLRAKQTAPLVNEHYENEVTLRQQN